MVKQIVRDIFLLAVYPWPQKQISRLEKDLQDTLQAKTGNGV